jgi:NAD(P)-dependent dehydrogenase (short-subunit alcohol dehydrogenase family)
MSIRVVTVFGGTGFLGRRVVRHLREHEFSVRIASRHPDRSRKLFGSDDPCLQSLEADIREERMVADVLSMRSAFTSNADKRLYMPYMSRQRSGWRFRRTGSVSNGSPTSRASGPMPPRHPSTSESAGKASWR